MKRHPPAKEQNQIEFQTTYWGPWMIYTKLDDSFIQELKVMSDKARGQKDKDYRQELAGNIAEEFNLNDHLSWFGERFRPWMDAFLMNIPRQEMLSYLLMNRAKEKGLAVGPNENIQYGWAIDSLWVNYQKKGEYNPIHNHSSDVSFVIYIDIPDEIHEEHKRHDWIHNHQGPGVIVFQYGNQEYFNVHNTWVLPNTGDVCIFPSWLQHYVHAFKSDVERISMSGNIILDVNLENDPDMHSSPILE